jgi:hypothetical protein
MSIKTKFAALAVAAAVAVGACAAGTQQAQAHPRYLGLGLGVGLATAAVVGTAIAASQPPYYAYPVRRCGWAPRYNAFGQYVGSIRTCAVY